MWLAQAERTAVHAFDSKGAAELFAASELAKAKAAGKSAPVWVVWWASDSAEAARNGRCGDATTSTDRTTTVELQGRQKGGNE